MSMWRWNLLLLPAVLAAGWLTCAHAEERIASSTGAAGQGARQVDLFDGIDNGELIVRLIHKDESQGKVLIENATSEPLAVKLPDAFAGVHVLPQSVSGSLGGIGQSSGGAFGGGGGGLGGGGAGGGGAGGGFFNVAPEKVGQLEVVSVCLEHGKPEPRPSMTYEVRRIESEAKAPEIAELLKLLGAGRIDQRIAQAVAWHFNSGLSWEELAAKKVERLGGLDTPYYTVQELQTAAAAAKYLTEQVEEQKKARPPRDGASPVPGFGAAEQ